jgi:hypothetical protein
MLERAEIDRIYRRHGPMVFRRARNLLGTDADAYEVLTRRSEEDDL